MDGDVGRPPRLVPRFVVGVIVAFVVIGVGTATVMLRTIRSRATSEATFHAEFVAEAVLAPALEGRDLDEPLSGRALEDLDAIVRQRILTDGRDVRVKLWAPDGTILYSDLHELIGRAFPDERSELEEVSDGEVSSEVSDLTDDENIGERALADKLLSTYVPLRLQPDGPVVAVAEIYQDYAAVQGEIDALIRRLGLILAGALVLLFAALLPIAFRSSRALRTQNERLREQADQLHELLEREQQTVAQLRDLDERKSDFVAAASHELRTPLASIVGYLRTLRNPDVAGDPAVVEEFLEAMDKQTQRLTRLIEGLLTSARLEGEGGTRIRLREVDVAGLVREVEARLRIEGRCRIDVSPDAASIVTDVDRLHDVLLELLDNAVKYSPEGGPIDVSATTSADGVVIAVRDHGLGIDPVIREHIFERFYQGDQSATRRFGGLGLGLSLVQGLVTELGGTIAVESTPGSGSTFTVTLPLVDQEPAATSDGRSVNAMASSSA